MSTPDNKSDENIKIKNLQAKPYVSKWVYAVLFLLIVLAIAAYFYFYGTANAYAQTGVLSDTRNISLLVRSLISVASQVVPAVILAYYSYKMRPKDAYEASWLAIGWCALAFIIK